MTAHIDTYEEFEIGETTVAMVAAADNQHAWIQSDVTVTVAP